MTTILIVDDHPLVRAGLRALIDATDDLTVVADTGDGQEAIRVAEHLSPDVVLMDLSMPGLDGIESTRRIRTVAPASAVVVLSSFYDSARIRDALRAGAIGYLLKDNAPADLLAGIRAAGRGHSPIDPRVAVELLPETAAAPADQLSARERQVLLLVAQGWSNRQIGHRLGIAERTVKVHVGNVFRRIGVADRTSAALWARDHQLS